MHTTRVRIGAVVLALFGGVLSLVGNLLVPPPPQAPEFAWYLGPAVGVLTLAGLALWWWRGSRAALWVVVVVNVLTALLPVPDLPSFDTPLVVVVVGSLVVTLVAVALVAPALRRGASRPAREQRGTGEALPHA